MSRRTALISAAVVLVAAVTAGVVVYRVKDPTPSTSSAGSSAASSEPTRSSRPSGSDSSSESPSESSESESESDDPDSTGELPAGDLPGDLIPNAVEDECLLTAAEFEVLTGEAALRAENTELAGDGRRSCFYGPADPDAEAGPAGRVDVYSSTSLPPSELVARIAANSAGSRPLTAVGSGAVVVSGATGTSELVVASPTLLVVLTLLPDAATTPPSDEAWTAAGATMVARLPA